MKSYQMLSKGMKCYLRALIGCTSLIFVSGCKSGESGNASIGGGGPENPIVESVSITIIEGTGFECFRLNRILWCRGVSANVDIGINSVEFESYFEDSDSSLIDARTWNDTLCVSSVVQDRPQSGGPGVATYCFGEATLGGGYSAYPIVYGGPSYSTATNGSSDVSYASEPMCGGDVSLTVFTGGSFVTDGMDLTSESIEDCELSEGILTCETFTTGVE